MIMNALNTLPHFMYMYVWGVSLVTPLPPPRHPLSPLPTLTHKWTNEEDLWLTTREKKRKNEEHEKTETEHFFFF